VVGQSVEWLVKASLPIQSKTVKSNKSIRLKVPPSFLRQPDGDCLPVIVIKIRGLRKSYRRGWSGQGQLLFIAPVGLFIRARHRRRTAFLKLGGRLVVGEIFGDPHMVTFAVRCALVRRQRGCGSSKGWGGSSLTSPASALRLLEAPYRLSRLLCDFEGIRACFKGLQIVSLLLESARGAVLLYRQGSTRYEEGAYTLSKPRAAGRRTHQ
jgi:hypothetical protein